MGAPLTETGTQKNLVWVERDTHGQVIRIFRNLKMALEQSDAIEQIERAEAVASIRMQVFNRAGWRCERCGAPLTYQTGQMDERVSKGEGGEVSLDNCWLLCHGCHQGRPDAEHGNRQPQFGKARQHGE